MIELSRVLDRSAAFLDALMEMIAAAETLRASGQPLPRLVAMEQLGATRTRKGQVTSALRKPFRAILPATISGLTPEWPETKAVHRRSDLPLRPSRQEMSRHPGNRLCPGVRAQPCRHHATRRGPRL